ncbi:MAG: biopolymer transporter ExbD [Flavobacteriales bacterium CG_4_10_14_0_2_um_filter_32_8]|nr:MAG: biopolymer transporter ExbD [Flavobacteriales bacterium CG_4_10_14_0_2_um_filter_32_8]PJB15514.1 MAG: biopolymer transporter ExbD [Flavobacteriales bacterium CG_4_9_14_3_um_filter_32_8]
MAIRSKNKISANFNMSSMTDIVFLLLIFFIIASTLISPNALEVLLPKASSVAQPQKQTVNISITQDLKYFVNKDEVAEQDVEAQLLAMVAGEKNPGIILRAEKSVPIENVVVIMDIANRNKLKLVLATKPK